MITLTVTSKELTKGTRQIRLCLSLYNGPDSRRMTENPRNSSHVFFGKSPTFTTGDLYKT